MELPNYLKNFEIDKFRAPATDLEKDLPFELLEPRIFERFCCDLLYKKMEFRICWFSTSYVFKKKGWEFLI